MVFKEKRTIMHLKPGPDNPRNSEGDFIRLPDGRIMFAYSRFRGDNPSDFAGSDIAAIYSSDNGESFGDNRILFKAAQFGSHNTMCVTLLNLSDGDIGVFFGYRTPGVKIEFKLMRSHDGAETFYGETTLLNKGFTGYYVINNSRVIRLSSGRLLVPTSRHRTGTDDNGEPIFDGRGVVFFLYSDDDGITWNEAKTCLYPNFGNTVTGLQEPGVCELPNGTIYCYIRTDQGTQYESFSGDRGMTWSPVQPSRFTSPASPMSIKRSPYSGIYYAVYNPIPDYNGRHADGWSRTPLVVRSSENGVDFGEPQLIENEPGHGYCYPAIYFPDEESILLSYCSGGPEENGFVLSRTTITKLII